ncbi:MAG: metalloregulator ArsR/SmtB family transcription factor [Gemmatimonadaceae bacterium]
MLSLGALADPTRRRIVEMLARGALSAGEIAEPFPISPSAVSQHLKILRDARLVRVQVAAKRRIYELDPAGLVEIDAWLDRIWPLWQKRIDALDRERADGAARAPSRWIDTRGTDG